MRAILYFVCLFLMSSSNLSAQMDQDLYDWKLKKEGSGVKVYTSKVPDSKFLAVSATVILNAKVDSVASLIMDLENCKKWATQCSEAYILERISNTETYVYSRNNIPFPGRDRDAVSHVIWEKDPVTDTVSMTSTAVEGRVAKVKGVIRIKQALAKWRFTPQQDGTLLVESFAHVNPASDMPKWLLNNLLVGSPFKTMKKIRKRLEDGVYDDAVLNF